MTRPAIVTRPADAPAARPGRPRRFDPDTEREMVMDAAMRCMAQGGFAALSVGAVLDESGLSTRAFYRHFGSRDALLRALARREAEAVGRSLARAVERARDPVAAVDAWLERFLDVFYEPRRAARTALFSSPEVRASDPLGDDARAVWPIVTRPLVEVLRAGHAAGVLHAPTPEADAHSLYALVGAAASPSDVPFSDRASARAHVVRFAWPALGISPPGGGS